MNRRLVRRGIIGVIAIAAILIGIYIVQSVRDVDLPRTADTVGYIAAIEEKPNGSQAVMIDRDGNLIESKGYHDGERDRDPVWRPDGNRLFFTSDRSDNNQQSRQVNLFRWNPASGKVERRSATQGSYTNLNFSGTSDKGNALVGLGGMIVQFDPITGDTPPVLPPALKDQSGKTTEGGRMSSIESTPFGNYGNSFKTAFWFGEDNKYVVAIMKGDNGDVLLLQDMSLYDGQFMSPAPIVAGDHIDADYNRKTGCIVFTVEHVRVPSDDPTQVPADFIKNGKVVLPFRHAIGILDPKNLGPGTVKNGPEYCPPAYIVQTPNDQNVFGMPTLSPDGGSVVVYYGVYANGELQTKGLVAMPAVVGGGNSPAFIHKGAVTGLSFSGDGKQIVYSQREANGSDSIHVMDNDGSNDKQLLVGKGNFTQPRFSPQVASSNSQ